jgi:hypothetical protein
MGLIALVLLPARFAAIRGDDTWVSESRGQNALIGKSLPGFVWDSAQNFLDSGRAGVGGMFQGLSTAWVIGDHPVGYHLLLIALTAVAAGLLFVLARRLGLSRSGALLVTVVLAGALQLRSYHDPLLGYWGTIQWVLIFVLGSLIVFQRALEQDSRRLLWLSVLIYLPAPVLYEGAFTLVPVYAALALFERRGMAALRPCLPYLAIAAAFVVLSLYLRANASVVPAGYELGSSPLSALRTYVIQLFAAIPASNLFFKADYGSFLPLGGHPTKAELAGALWRGLVVFGLVALLSIRLASPDGSKLPGGRVLGRLAIVGGLIWATAGIAVAAAPKYQAEIVAGKNHLPSLIEAFGWSLVAAAALLGLMRAAAQRSRAALWLVALAGAGLLGLGAGMTAFNNLRVVGLEVPVAQTRGLLERAVSDGLLRSVPERGTLIFASQDLVWDTGNFNQFPISLEAMLFDHTGRRFDGRLLPPPQRLGCATSPGLLPQECERPAGYVAWVRVRARPGGGSVIVATLPPRTRRPLEVPTRKLRVYARNTVSGVRPPRVIALTTAGRAWSSERVRWRRVQAAGDTAIYEARVPPLRATTVDDSGSKFTFGPGRSPEQIVRIYGSKRLLP